METVLLLFLLMSFGKDGDAKQSLEKFLSFYRENRELLALLMNGMNVPKGISAAATQEEHSAPPQENPHEKSRPREEDGNLNILEEFLKTRAV